MQLEPTNIMEGIIEDYGHSNTFLLVKVWKNLIVHEYYDKVYGL